MCERAPFAGAVVERDAEFRSHGPKRISRELAVAEREGAPQHRLSGPLGRGSCIGGIFRAWVGHCAGFLVQGDLAACQFCQQGQAVCAEVGHASLRHHGETQVRERRQGANEGSRFGEDVGSQREAERRTLIKVRYLNSPRRDPAAESIARGAFFEVGGMCDSGHAAASENF